MINFAEVLKIRGKSVPFPGIEGDGRLGDACIIALDASMEKDRNEGLKPKLHRGNLIEKIEKSMQDISDIVVSAEDVAMLKSRVAEVYSNASLVTTVVRLIDPAERPAPAEVVPINGDAE